MEGFAWLTKFYTSFIPSKQARKITRALRRAGQPLDKDLVLQYFTELFSKACDLVDQCKLLKPVQFWKEVGSQLPWARYLSGSDLLDFSNRIVCARARYLDGWHFYHFRIRFQIPDSHREPYYTQANIAVDRWRVLVENVYEDYFPWWLTDSDNEGSAEAMLVRFTGLSIKDDGDENTKMSDDEDMKMSDDENMKMSDDEKAA
ncbi:hypothetical protein F5Y13DRAFT_187700 [Hypoxylon sp. FL1857]|nr:hypothetical protein F5Y13DRAFT_187700 [Hypoxylon sp. FL1857]